MGRKTAKDIVAFKNSETPMVCLTAYTAPFARILDEHTDLILVGDSLGMVLYGMDSTLPVTLDMMINHGRAVVKSTKSAFVVVDLPFGSYQASKEQAFEAAARVMAESGCGAVKIEGGIEMAETVSFLQSRGVPVVGHIGLQPQSVNTLSGYRVTGRDSSEAARLMLAAKAIEDAGAIAIVIECTDEDVSTEITNQIKIPTIGIGASVNCDGQILVTEDLLGITDGPLPRFVKKYADLSENIKKSVSSYAKEVRNRKFPGASHVYKRPVQDNSKVKAVK